MWEDESQDRTGEWVYVWESAWESVGAMIHKKVLDYVKWNKVEKKKENKEDETGWKIQQILFLKYATICWKRGHADRHERQQLLYRRV